jgi:hypothetical protein
VEEVTTDVKRRKLGFVRALKPGESYVPLADELLMQLNLILMAALAKVRTQL